MKSDHPQVVHLDSSKSRREVFAVALALSLDLLRYSWRDGYVRLRALQSSSRVDGNRRSAFCTLPPSIRFGDEAPRVEHLPAPET